MNIRLGTWNITQLTRKGGKKVEDIQKYKIEIPGISETQVKGTGEMTLDENYVLKYSGVDKKTRAKMGVGIIISEELNRNVTKQTAINSSIIRLDTDLREKKITFIQIYASMEHSDEYAKAYYCKGRMEHPLRKRLQKKKTMENGKEQGEENTGEWKEDARILYSVTFESTTR